MIDKEKVFNYDSQGFPLQAMSIRDILEQIGAKLEDGKYVIENTEDLDSIPLVLEDDGMGYGFNDKYIYSFRPDSIFVEKPLENIELWLKGEFYYCACVKYSNKKYYCIDIKEEDDELMYLCKRANNVDELVWVNGKDLKWY